MYIQSSIHLNNPTNNKQVALQPDNKDAHNLNTLPELLLMGGGVPVWYSQHLIDAIGVSAGGSGENYDSITKQAIQKSSFIIDKK